MQSLTPIRQTVETRAAERPDLRDVFLCHAWDDRQGPAKDLHDLLVAAGVKVWFSEKDLALAEKLAEKLKQDRDSSTAARRERIHLFISAPNAFTFYLGRQVAMMKPLTLYEYDFTYQVDGSYRPSLSYPEVTPIVGVIN